MKRRKIKIIDLFAGVGGFRVAFERVNEEIGKDFFNVVWGNQWEPGKKVQYAAEIYRERFKVKNKDFVNDDIAKIKTKDIPNHDMLVGGFPCQDYSVATTKKLSKGLEGKKGVLWWEIERIIREKKAVGEMPEFLLLENVDRLITSPAKQRGRDFAIMLACLDLLGYMVEWRIIDASAYGFPQRRKRIYILGYKKDSSIYNSFKGDFESWVLKDGVFSETFGAIIKPNTKVEEVKLYKESKKKGKRPYYETIKYVSDNFNKSGKPKSPFKKAGLLYKGQVYTMDLEPVYEGEKWTLGKILITDESQIPSEFFILEEEKGKWIELKGAKAIDKVGKDENGKEYPYTYREGAVTFPDDLNRPSRTIITGEGGKGPSRFKHVILTPSGKWRRLTPVELERLDMFDDNHTQGYTPQTRAFLMGNALVVGVIENIAKGLYSKINKTEK